MGTLTHVRLAVWALLVVPGVAAAAMLALAIPAGDSVNDSVLILLGAPAAASAIVTALLATTRTDNPRLPSIAAWALGSAIAAVVIFGVLFWAAWSVDCATREGSCS